MKLSRGRKILFILFIIFFLVFIVVLFLLSSKKNEPAQTTQKGGEASVYNKAKSYFINRVDTKIPVNGYSWEKGILLYSTPLGIFEAGKNNQLVNKPVDYIKWNSSGQAILKSDNSWFLFDSSKDPSLASLNMSFNSPRLLNNGKQIVDSSLSTIEVIDIESGQRRALDLKAKIDQIDLSGASNLIAVVQKSLSGDVITIFDTDLTERKKIQENENFDSIALSNDGKNFAIFENDKLTLKPVFANTDTETSFSFTSGSSLIGSWINTNQIIVIETTPPDEVGRKINFIWRVGITGTKELITGTYPIPRRLDTSYTSLYVSPDQTFFPVIERQGNLWLVALIPDFIPGYIEKGRVLYPGPNAGD